MPPQRCKLNIKHVVLYVGHLYKPFWIKKKLTGLAGGGQGRSRYGPGRTPEMEVNQSGAGQCGKEKNE